MDNNIVRTYRDIRQDFVLVDPLFTSEPDKVRRVKEIVLNRIPQVDRTIILMYADCGSLREMGRRLGLSHSSVKVIVDRIREDILREYYAMAAKEINQQL